MFVAQPERPEFDVLYRDHFEAVWRFVGRRLPAADVDDVANEVFVVAWRRRREIESEFTRAWLYGVARRLIANRLRQRRRQANLVLRIMGFGSPESITPYEVEGAIDPTSRLGMVWDTLTANEREILMLQAWEGVSSVEIAVTLGISEAAARQRLSRALRSARESWRSLGPNSEG